MCIHMYYPRRYAGCSKCNKKAIGDDSSGFSCESCGWSGDAATYRFIVGLRLEVRHRAATHAHTKAGLATKR